MYARVLVCSVLLVHCVFSRDFPILETSENSEEESDDVRVVGGRVTSIEEHPYQVSLLYRDRHSCGGSIISKKWIVTAAHCVYSVFEDDLKVKAGSSTLNGKGQVVGIRKVIVHEKYTNYYADYDIALLELDSPLRYSEKVGPIKLASVDDHDGPATVTGWGSIKSNGPSSNLLREVQVPLIYNRDCAELYGPKRITRRMLCAGYIGHGGKDACQGDSGGPLVLDGKLIGIVSWGYGCAEPLYPGVYTRVAELRSWVSKNSGL